MPQFTSSGVPAALISIIFINSCLLLVLLNICAIIHKYSGTHL